MTEQNHDTEPTNRSGNRTFADILSVRISRRHAITAGAAAGAAAFAIAGSPTLAAASAAGSGGNPDPHRADWAGPNIGFTSIPLGFGPMPAVAPEYQMSVLIPWRTRLDGNGEYGEDLTAAQQEAAIGLGHDGMWFFPTNNQVRSDVGYLCINHEYGTNPHGIGKDYPESAEDVAKSQALHGVSVVKIRQTSHGNWELVPSAKNRRITPNTPVSFAGPAADSDLLITPAGNPPAGTLNNCANGYTPWGTYLTCEENFNGYFGTADEAWTPDDAQERYGFSTSGFGYGWHEFDAKWDLSSADYKNSENRFGWVVEIDPHDQSANPTKRTALGRVKHEGAAFTEGLGGRAVVYMGDDQRFDYLYRYVSDRSWRAMRSSGVSPLDHGTLYVAEFHDDGSGTWHPLTPNHPALAGWHHDRILVFTRLAADAVGATPMDRPEWTTVGRKGEVFVTLTNNSRRTEPNSANPLVPNTDGHIIRIMDEHDHTGERFAWDIFAVSQEVADEGGQMYGSPDGVWADQDGRLFVQTDGDQPNDANDQLLVADPESGSFRRLFTGVTDCEVTGIAVTPDRRTMFVNLQHPGNGDPAATNFPAEFTGASGPKPRDCTIVLTRKDGGIVGS